MQSSYPMEGSAGEPCNNSRPVSMTMTLFEGRSYVGKVRPKYVCTFSDLIKLKLCMVLTWSDQKKFVWFHVLAKSCISGLCVCLKGEHLWCIWRESIHAFLMCIQLQNFNVGFYHWTDNFKHHWWHWVLISVSRDVEVCLPSLFPVECTCCWERTERVQTRSCCVTAKVSERKLLLETSLTLNWPTIFGPTLYQQISASCRPPNCFQPKLAHIVRVCINW